MADEGLKITDAVPKLTLDGTEELPANSAGNDVKVTAQGIADLADIGDKPVDKIDFTPQVTTLTHEPGRMYFDSVQDAMVYYNSVSDISMQLGLEIWVRCYNNSGLLITDNAPVYISGADVTTELPEINLADSNIYEKSRVIGLATHSIGIGAIGYVSFFGVINNYNAAGSSVGDIIYLSSEGTVKNTFPADGEFATRLGVIIKDGAAGKLQLSISTSQYTVETLEQNGFPDTSNLSVTFDDPTYTLTVAPVDSIRVRYYGKGIKYFSEGAGDTFQISDVSGLHFIYYDNGVLTEIVDPTLSQQVSILSNYASVTSIYWRAGDRQIYFGNQAHSSIGYGSRQIGLDQVKFGAEYVPGSGLGLNDFVIGSGALDSHAQFSISSGQISNSDLLITTPAFASTVGVEVAYVDATGIWQRATNTGFSFLNTGTGRVAYQDPVLGGLVEVTDGNYVLYHIIATNDYTSAKRVLSIPGLAEYSSVANAEAEAIEEAATIIDSAPIRELVSIGIVIIQTKDSYANTVNARIVQTSDLENYIDTRTTGVGGGGGGSTPQTTFSDAEFRLFDETTLNEKSDVLDNYTANRSVTWPDKSMTVAGTDDITHKVKITLNDTTEDYLDAKFTVGNEFTKTINNPSGNENILLTFKGWIYNAGRTFYSSIVSLATANRTVNLPDKDGTIAFLDDIQSIEKDPFTESIEITNLLQHSPTYVQTGEINLTKDVSSTKIGGTYEVSVEMNGSDWNIPDSTFEVINDEYFNLGNLAGRYRHLFALMGDGKIGVNVYRIGESVFPLIVQAKVLSTDLNALNVTFSEPVNITDITGLSLNFTVGTPRTLTGVVTGDGTDNLVFELSADVQLTDVFTFDVTVSNNIISVSKSNPLQPISYPVTISSGGLFDVVTSIANLGVFLDAKDDSSVIHTSQAVTQWSDLSGNGNHAIVSTDGNPTYSDVNDEITWDGVNDKLRIEGYAFSTDITVFVVAKKLWANPTIGFSAIMGTGLTTTTDFAIIHGSSSAGQIVAAYINSMGDGYNAGQTPFVRNDISGFPINDNDKIVFTSRMGSTLSEIRVNKSAANNEAQATGSMSVGTKDLFLGHVDNTTNATRYLSGSLSCVIIYDRVLTSQEVADVENEINTYYNLGI